MNTQAERDYKRRTAKAVNAADAGDGIAATERAAAEQRASKATAQEAKRAESPEKDAKVNFCGGLYKMKTVAPVGGKV